MRASDLIVELQTRMDLFGDFTVVLRVGDEDIDVDLIYADDDAERIIISE